MDLTVPEKVSIVGVGKRRPPTTSMPHYKDGGKKSWARLRQLGFDPIGELVETYRKLQKELEYHEKLQSGEMVQLSTVTGRPLAYRAEVHLSVYDRLITIGDKLLRFGYGRVPEISEDRRPVVPALTVNLTKPGETFVINAGGDDVNFDEDDDGDEF